MFEDNLKERYGLAIDRIAEIKENSEIEDAGLAAYFTYTAEFLLLVDKWNEKRKAGGYDKLPLEELQHWKRRSGKRMTHILAILSKTTKAKCRPMLQRTHFCRSSWMKSCRH